MEILYYAERNEPYKHISNMIQIALNLIDVKFEGKFDKGGNDYKDHLLHVSSEVANYANNECKNKYTPMGIFFNKAFIVALLHDIIEDTELTIDDLIKEGIDDTEILDAIKTLTKDPNERYFDYIKKVKENDIAKFVKRFDLLHNMDLTRLTDLNEKDLKRINKYWWSWKFLIGETTEELAYSKIYNKNANS